MDALLPLVDALLNLTALVWLLIGYVRIRRRDVAGHRRAMLTAFAASMAFLAVYLVHHARVGSKPFPEEAPAAVRTIYLGILASHVVLAAAVPFLAGWTIYLAWSGKTDRHRRIARWTLPIWLYVSVTGLLVYVMLYQLYG